MTDYLFEYIQYQVHQTNFRRGPNHSRGDPAVPEVGGLTEPTPEVVPEKKQSTSQSLQSARCLQQGLKIS